jgi:hypothetical protein
MTRRSRACSALAVLAALAPRCAGGAEAQVALSLALGAASGRTLARCDYACDAAGCGALRACTPAAAHEAADDVRCMVRLRVCTALPAPPPARRAAARGRA